MKTNFYPFSIFRIFLVACFALILQIPGMAQPYAINTNVSNAQPSANESFEITFSIADPLDFYYGGMEVSYSTDLFESTGVENTGLSAGGLHTTGEISSGTIGVSVSRTSPLSAPDQGDFMKLTFLVKGSATAETAHFIFSGQEISDSEGNLIETSPIEALSVDIQESIGRLWLTIPQTNTTTEGDPFNATGKVFATGVTDTNRINAWAGISNSNTDPSTWPESAWHEMKHQSTDASGNLEYSREVALQRSDGTWYIALRAQLDAGSYTYGGADSLWDADSSPSASLTINQQPPHRYTLAEWNFNNEVLTPSNALPVNQEATIELTGASFEGFSSGASGSAANSNGWNGGSGTKYWRTSISTAGFTDIEVSSKQYGSNTGPRDFIVEVSTDGTRWQAVEGGNVHVGNNWSSGVLDTLSLPEILADQENAFIRWVMASDTSVDNGDISSSGTNRLDDVIITGVNLSSQRVEVYPGDANNDSLVNADDVLALGTYWLARGPVPIYNSMDFIPREVEAWIPPEATYADTRGDGRVDHRDLMPVGLHFGKTVSAIKKLHAQPSTEIQIEPREAGAEIPLVLASERPKELRGISLSLSITGVAPDRWEIQNIQPLFCPDSWHDKLLSFEIKKGQLFESAFVLKGKDDMARAEEFVSLNLKALEEWTTPVTIAINRVTISNENSDKRPVRFVNLLATDVEGELNAYGSKLYPNRPNPFQNYTIIPYELSARTHVRLEILNIQGQVVATLVDKVQSAGKYSVHYNPSDLPPGNYLYRIQTGTGYMKCKKMMHVK
jgi:hypothetical protein